MESKLITDNNSIPLLLETIHKLYNDKEKLIIQLMESKKQFDPVLDRPLQSEQRNALSEAMAKAHMEYPRLGPNSTNSFNQSKYSNLENILWVCRPIIGKHGVQFEQKIYATKDNTYWLITGLYHNSGQWSESRSRIVPETSTKASGYQEFGKACTYQARYAALCMLGIRPTKDELDDDDQENAQQKEYDQFYKNPSQKSNDRPTSTVTISADELREIKYELDLLNPAEMENNYNKILKKYDIDDLADLPKVHYRYTIDKLREIRTNMKNK